LQLPPGSIGSKFRVGSIELVESVLTPEGSVYETLGTFALLGRS
jgi:2'-5' RNA ligase